jgi:aryl-alcohol dehydrogenase-like predicted oxidoreductase
MAPLEQRRLGRTEMRPKAMGMGGAWWQAHPASETIAAIERAIDLGIDFFDTYPGEFEARWGEALSGGKREQVYLQGKVSSAVNNERTSDHSAAKTRSSLEASLKSLRTDYLDSVLIHGYDKSEQLNQEGYFDPLGPGNALDELIKMRDEGLIRHIGIGARDADVINRATATGEIEIVLTYMEYNLLTQAAAADFFPQCRERDVGLILASPHGMGILTGDEPDDEAVAKRLQIEKPRANDMWKWCRDRSINIRHMAIQFCMAAPDIDSIVLPGPASVQQLEEAYEAGTELISAEVWRDFEAEFGIGV